MGHIVSSDWNGIGYTTCLLCGGLAEIGFFQIEGMYFANSIVSEIYVLEYFGNDSYLLSNGVIVLSDVDLVLFLNQTLVIPSYYYENHETHS